MAKKCTICGLAVDLNNLHPDSLEIPQSGEWAAMHAGCAAGEDAHNGANPNDEELSDNRAWIKIYA